jgi:hypothetical protein
MHLVVTVARLLGPGGARSIVAESLLVKHQRKLLLYKKYYNRDRVHRGLDGAPPDAQSGRTDRKVTRLNDYRWKEHCRGLYQLPEAA